MAVLNVHWILYLDFCLHLSSWNDSAEDLSKIDLTSFCIVHSWYFGAILIFFFFLQNWEVYIWISNQVDNSNLLPQKEKNKKYVYELLTELVFKYVVVNKKYSPNFSCISGPVFAHIKIT